jgi:hypothetical protein
MSNIRFNLTTKEIEIEGPESFIEASFSRVQDLLIESLGMRKPRSVRKPPKAEEQVLFIDSVEPGSIEEIKIPEDSKAPDEFQANAIGIPSVPQIAKENRLIVRKSVRKEDGPNNKDKVADLIKDIPEKVSIASLKENLGLTEHQIEGIIRDAEKQGRIRKDEDGSYLWV